MDSVSTKDLAQLVKMIGGHVDQPDRLVLQSGSATYGRAWRLFVSARAGGQGGLRTFLDLDNGYLGWTKREAYCTLTGLLTGLGVDDVPAEGRIALGEPS